MDARASLYVEMRCSIIIMVINIIGGFLIGVLQKGMTF